MIIHQMAVSDNRLNYFLRWGWIDLVSSIPAIGFLRWGRLVRTIWLLKLMKLFRMLIKSMFNDKASGTLVTAGLGCFMLLIVSSSLIYSADPPVFRRLSGKRQIVTSDSIHNEVKSYNASVKQINAINDAAYKKHRQFLNKWDKQKEHFFKNHT